MGKNEGDEKGPAKKRPSYRNVVINSDSDKPNNSSEEWSSEGEGITKEGKALMENLEESCPSEAPVLPPLQSYQSEEPECITLSSDEEMEGEERPWSGNVVGLVLVKMEDGGEDEKDMDIGNKYDEVGQVKKRRKKRPKRGKSTDGPVIVREYSLQEQSEMDHQQLICKYCKKKMKTKKSLAEHIRTQHKGFKGPSACKCETCGKETKSERLLKFHQLVHTNDYPMKCDLCRMKFKSQFYLEKHLKSNKHKSAEFMDNETLGGNEEDLTSPPPLLLAERSLEDTRNSDASSWKSLKVKASLFSETKMKSTSVHPSGTPTSKISSTNIPSSIYASPKSAIGLSPSVPSSGVSSTMTHNSHNSPIPVLFYGYMIQPNAVTQPVQYHSPLYSGMSSPQTMQQMSYHRHPTSFTDYSQPLFICLECKAKFSVEAHLHSHMRNAHSNDCWKCPNCLDEMVSPGKFEEHFSQCIGVKS